MRLPIVIVRILVAALLAAPAASASRSDPEAGEQASALRFVATGAGVRAGEARAWLQGLRMPLPPGPVRLTAGCELPYAVGCMEWTEPYPTVGLTRRATRETLVHELGHVFDMLVLAPLGLRERFAEIDGRPWETPASEERFAQAYAVCALRRWLPAPVASSYHDFRLTPRQFTASCLLIKEAHRLRQGDPGGADVPPG